LIHTFEMMMLVAYYDIQNLFSMYGINLNKYEHFGAAVKQLNKEIKKNFDAYAVTWISCQASGEWNLHVKIDIVKMLDKGEILEEDYDLVESDIRKFLIHHFGHSLYFDSHILKRIDYKLDFYVPNSKDRELLFFLLEKYTAKYGYKEKIKWGKDENNNPFKYETSQYHKSKSVELVIYDKEEERIAKGEEIQPYDKGRVRYELRLKNSHLNSMKRKDKGKSRLKKLRSYFLYHLWKEYMERHILPIVHRGDYYKITEAEKIIENSNFPKKKKNDLRVFLVQISKGSIDTPKKHMSPPTYRKYLQDLASIGVNPILIPKNRTDFPNCLKNPFKI